MVCITEGSLPLISYAVHRVQNNEKIFQWETPVKGDVDLQTYFSTFHTYIQCNACAMHSG